MKDRERGIPSAIPRNGPDDQFSDRIKSMEQQIVGKNASAAEKKPKDLLRAIGKIESNDWNFREIEKKIEQSKKTEVSKSREKVPKWSKEQFLQRQNKMARPKDEQEGIDDKYKDIDETIKNVDRQIKEGSMMQRGQRGKNKVASIAGNFVKKEEIPVAEEQKTIQKSGSKVGLVFSKQSVSEVCHFCKQRVYLMEKIAAEGLVLHRACLKCHHCHTSLRLGSYAFDRDDPEGRFYCTQHFRLPAKAMRPAQKKLVGRSRDHEATASPRIVETPDKLRGRPEGVVQMELLDRGNLLSNPPNNGEIRYIIGFVVYLLQVKRQNELSSKILMPYQMANHRWTMSLMRTNGLIAILALAPMNPIRISPVLMNPTAIPIRTFMRKLWVRHWAHKLFNWPQIGLASSGIHRISTAMMMRAM